MSLTEKKPLFKILQKKRSAPEVKEEIQIPIRFTTKKKIKNGPWSSEEDQILKKYVEDHGPRHWAQCAEILQERTGKQCSERWRNCLNEGIRKGEWTAEENLLVLKLYDKFKSYKKIAIVFPGRTENSLKNRMFIQLRKVALKNNKKSVSKIKLDELKLYFDEAVRKAEETYFNRNKDATFEKFEEYLKEIENIVEKAQNQKEGSIYLNDLRDKIIKNNYDSDSFSGVYEDEQKKVREIEKIEKKELKKEKARIQRRANYEKQKQEKAKEKEKEKEKEKLQKKKSSTKIKNQITNSRLFSKNNLDFLYSRYSLRNRNSTQNHLGDDFEFERPMAVKKSSVNLLKNNSNLNLSSYFLRGPSNMKSSFNIFNPSLNNSYFSMSKRGSQFNIFNSKSRISSENY